MRITPNTRPNQGILLKSPQEVAIMRETGYMTALVHQTVQKEILPGITTGELDQLIEELIISFGAYPSTKGYDRYPAASCICVNDEMVHVIPGKRKLREGDIVSIDFGVFHRGFHADSCWTYGVGAISEQASNLLEINKRALFAGIEQAQSGKRIHDIGKAIHDVVESSGLRIARGSGGHGVGKNLHESPFVPCYYDSSDSIKLRFGMVLAIEPIVCTRSTERKVSNDGWSTSTVDGSLCSQFEHTIAIQESGEPLILTTI